jgi:membrane protein implicated in regulation of membrane protease activity
MLAGFTLALALVALLAAVVAILLALYAIGEGAKVEKRTDTLEQHDAEMQGHRLRIDGNVQVLARNMRIPDGVVVPAKSPERPQ